MLSSSHESAERGRGTLKKQKEDKATKVGEKIRGARRVQVQAGVGMPGRTYEDRNDHGE